MAKRSKYNPYKAHLEKFIVIVRWLDFGYLTTETAGGSTFALAMKRAWVVAGSFFEPEMTERSNWKLTHNDGGSVAWLDHVDVCTKQHYRKGDNGVMELYDPLWFEHMMEEGARRMAEIDEKYGHVAEDSKELPRLDE